MRTKIEHRWSSGRRASARFIVFLISLLLVAAYFPALLTTAAAEDETSTTMTTSVDWSKIDFYLKPTLQPTTVVENGGVTTLINDATGIEVDVETSALPRGMTVYLSVGVTPNAVLDPTENFDELDKDFFWQAVMLTIQNNRNESVYDGPATIRFPIDESSGTVEGVYTVTSLMADTPVRVAFSTADGFLTMRADIPTYFLIGATDLRTLLPYSPPDPDDEEEKIVDGILDGIKDFFGEMFDDIGVFLEAAFGGIGDTLNDIGSAFHDFVNWVFDLPNAISRYFEDKSRDEFNDFLQKDWTSTFSHALLGVVNDVYEIFYPFGVFVMLIAWCFGVTQAGFTLNLDPTNKYSIIRALLQLLVGMVLLTITPWLLMLIFSLCNGIRLLVASQVQAVAGHSIVLFIFQLKIYLNLAYIALLQCVSPVFMGAAAGGEGVRRFTTNFLKEYGLRCMEIVLVTLYVLMVDRIENSYSVTNNLGLISRILMPVVLSVSVFTIDKKFEKLFH